MAPRRWLRWTWVAVLTAPGAFPCALSAQPAPPPAPAPPVDPAERARRSLAQDGELLGAGKTQPERDDAARRLVARQSVEARAILRAALASANNPPAQYAAARALVDDPAPDAQFIPPLLAMLGDDRQASEAAAYALTAYGDLPAALDPLLQYAQTLRPVSSPRAAAVRALGATLSRRAAATLINLLQTDKEAIVRNAAADALGDMTLLRENGRDTAAWQQWWAANQGKSPLQFKADLADRYKRQRPGLPADLDKLLQDLYQAAAENQKPAVLQQMLSSADPGIRAAAVRQLLRVFFIKGRIPDVELARLREMIGDWAPEVRAEAARVIGLTNDKPSLEPLLVQLVQEPDPAVRVAITDALVPINDVRAVRPLIARLNDPSLRVAVRAAEALAKFGPTLRGAADNTPLLQEVGAALRTTLAGRGARPGGAELRAACTEALVPLGDPRSPTDGRLFLNLLSIEETPRTRKAAVQGLGVLGDPRTADAIIRWLPIEPEGTVRLAALESFAGVGSFAFAEGLFEYTRPGVEKDPSVRDAAWKTIVKLLPSASKQQLQDWYERRVRDDPAKALDVLVALSAKQEGEELAATKENIGSNYVKLGRADLAIRWFSEALQFWDERGATGLTVAGLIPERLDAHLQAKQYTEAAQFAQDRIAKDPTQTQVLIARLVKEAENLIASKNPRDALRLAGEAFKIKPPLPFQYADRLKAVQAQAEQSLGSEPR